mmetsp:Transcript_10990/g.24420  ORF Transcript_10990/g.24420 Transcript_10990/m.24420 type:complete len:108 (+) Transcript_10990:207-530(+)
MAHRLETSPASLGLVDIARVMYLQLCSLAITPASASGKLPIGRRARMTVEVGCKCETFGAPVGLMPIVEMPSLCHRVTAAGLPLVCGWLAIGPLAVKHVERACNSAQ